MKPGLDEGEKAGLQQSPDWVSPGAQVFWRQWCGAAILERTLTPSTAAGFAQLCQQAAYLSVLVDKINHLGAGTTEAAPYLLTYLKLAQRVDTSLARFKLTAFGKPAVGEKLKPAANPWASYGQTGT